MLPPTPSQAAHPVAAVLDTNVVLAWLWFADPRVAALATAVRSGRLRWIATAAMHDELAHVLQRLSSGMSAHSVEHALTSFMKLAVIVDAPPPVHGLRCTDSADQKFIDLAVTARCRLFSRDRAVLKLARRAAAAGVSIGPPERWSMPAAAAY